MSDNASNRNRDSCIRSNLGGASERFRSGTEAGAGRITFSRGSPEVGESLPGRGARRTDSVIFIFYWRLVSHYLADHGAASWSFRVLQTVSSRWTLREPVVSGREEGRFRKDP